jgi:hypothetical protein
MGVLAEDPNALPIHGLIIKTKRATENKKSGRYYWMSGDNIVSILQVGLSGLAFLLAWFSYHLISREQAKADPRPEVLRSARLYFYQCIALAVIVGGFQFFHTLVLRPGPEELAACADSMMLLEDQARKASGNVVPLADVEAHRARCSDVIRRLAKPR